MTTQSLTTDEEQYLSELAAKYGLLILRDGREIRLAFHRNGVAGPVRVTVASVHRLHSGRFGWDVYPLGASRFCDGRTAGGYAHGFGTALGDAEGMLRHILRSTTVSEVEEVWGPDILDVLSQSEAELTFARLAAMGGAGSVCVSEENGN